MPLIDILKVILLKSNTRGNEWEFFPIQHLDSASEVTPTNHPLAIQASSPPKPKIIVKT